MYEKPELILLFSYSFGLFNCFPIVAALFSIPLILILAPTLFASFYVSYRDVFVVVDEDA